MKGIVEEGNRKTYWTGVQIPAPPPKVNYSVCE